MKLIKYLYFFVLFIIFTTTSFSQSRYVMILRSAPSFTLQFNLNYNQSYLDFNGTFNNDFHSDNFIKGEALGADKGYGASLTSKLPIGSQGKLRLNVSLNYNTMKTYLFGNNYQLADIGNTKINLATLGLGLEHNFTANHKFKIYIGAEGTATLLNGKGTIWVENRGNPDGAYSYDIKISNSFRIGAAIFAGSEYMLNDKFGVSMGFKYNFVNLFLKDAKQTTDPNSKEFPLRDKYVPNVLYSGDKTLAYISLMAGVNLYWGVIDKRYVIKR